MGRLDKKVAVITGAASGIGLATAARFAGEGAAVVIGDLNLEGGEAAVRQCKENGGRAVFQKCDVQTESDIKALIDRALSEFGKLDIIFNNAGLGGAVGTIEETSVENWDKTQAILLRAVFIGMKYAVPAMKKSGGGFDHLDRLGRGTSRRRRSAFLQRSEGGRHQPDALGCARGRRA